MTEERTFDDEDHKDHEPAPDASEECDQHPHGYPSAHAMDDAAPSEPPPLPAPSAPPFPEDVTHSQLDRLAVLRIVYGTHALEYFRKAVA